MRARISGTDEWISQRQRGDHNPVAVSRRPGNRRTLKDCVSVRFNPDPYPGRCPGLKLANAFGVGVLRATGLRLRVTELLLRTTELHLRTTQLDLRTTGLHLRITEIVLRATELILRATELRLCATEPLRRTTLPRLRAVESRLRTPLPLLAKNLLEMRATWCENPAHVKRVDRNP